MKLLTHSYSRYVANICSTDRDSIVDIDTTVKMLTRYWPLTYSNQQQTKCFLCVVEQT